MSDSPAPPQETGQEVNRDSIPEEAPSASVSDDPDVPWDLMASGFFLLTGQWTFMAERRVE